MALVGSHIDQTMEIFLLRTLKVYQETYHIGSVIEISRRRESPATGTEKEKPTPPWHRRIFILLPAKPR
jgi:hypothetical protein